MGKDAPDPPDYEAVAYQQAQAEKEALAYQNQVNRPTQVTPWGTSKWTIDPETGESTQNVTLDPVDQQALDYQQQTGRDLSRTAANLTGRVAGDLSNPVDYGNFRNYGELDDFDTRRQTAEDAAYGRATSRLDPYWDQKQQEMEVKLMSQGLVPGDEAYDNAMGNLNRAQNDAYALAQADSVAAGRAESDLAFRQELGTAEFDNTTRQSQIAEELQRRGWTINEINALISGRSVGMPEIPEFSSSGRYQAPDLMGAAQAGYQGELDQYNSEQAALSGVFSGIGGVAKAASPFLPF